MFNRKFKLFRLFGFEVGIDPSWIVLALLVAWSLSTGYFPVKYHELSSRQYWIMGIIGALGLFLSIVAHEFCHSLVARRSGLPMKGITLFIFGGVAEMNAEPTSARDEFIIAVVGPVSSFAMAAIFYGLNRLGETAGWPTTINGVMGYLGMINVILAVFNLVPAFPLDGGRILRAALWAWKGNLRWATRLASQFGQMFGLLLIALGILRVLGGFFVGGMWFFLIGLFISMKIELEEGR
jgi:Zn-dependent protease